MKINRLLEITTILLNRRTVTAAELAERFGVSTRTIYRDIEVLSGSGVPVYTTQGAKGGISLLENYALNRALLSDEESGSILLALRTLQSTRLPEVEAVLDKLGGLFQHAAATDWVAVDFSPWGSNPNANDKFQEIKTAILQARVIEFDYVNAANEHSHRQVLPLRLQFKSEAWYLAGWCRVREAFRVFRISRMKNVVGHEERFDRIALLRREKGAEQRGSYAPGVHLKLRFSNRVLYRLYDDYNDECLCDNGDGTFTVGLDFPEDEWVYGYLLSFGADVEVLEPLRIRGRL